MSFAARLSEVRTAGRWVLRRVRRVPPRELLTTFRAGLVLACVEAVIRLTPLPRLAVWCGVELDLTPRADGVRPLCVDELAERDQRALRATRRATAIWPFCNGPCLRRALVGGHLLRRLDPAVRLGVAADTDLAVRAHAWLEVQGRPLEDVDEFEVFQQRASSGRSGIAPVSDGVA